MKVFGIVELLVVVTVNKPLLTEPLLQSLNPLQLEIIGATDLPPTTHSHEPVYVKLDFFNGKAIRT